MTVKVPNSVQEIRDANQGFPFPKYILNSCESALMLFCAGFYGKNDCAWVEEAGLKNVQAMDNDEDRMTQMIMLYPPEWSFVTTDVYEWLNTIGSEVKFDLVVADFQTDQITMSKSYYERLGEMANKFLLFTIWSKDSYKMPAGFHEIAILQRTSSTAWLLLKKWPVP